MSTQPQLVILFADTPIGRATLTAAGILKLARVGVGQREAGSMDPAALAAAVRAAAPAGVSHLLIAVDGDPCDLEVTEEGIDLLTGYMTRQIELLGELGPQLQGGSATFMASRGLLTRPELREWFDAGLTHVEASLKAYDVKVNMLVPGIPEESAAAWLLRIVAPAVAGHIVIPDEHDTLVTPVAAGIDLVAEERTAQVAALEEIAVTRESAAARGELVALREQQANLSGELSQLGTLLAARRAERAEAEDRINELVHQQATVRRDISEAQELLSDLAGRRAEAAALLGEAREHMLAATGERDALRLDLETSETSRRELEQELAMLRQESDTLRRDVSHVATEHATTSAEVTRDSGHLLQLRQQIEAAQTELERTRTESSNARDGAESAVADMLRRIEQLRGEEDISRQGMLQAQQMVQDARGELTELRRQEGLANEELSRIQSAQEVTMISLRELGGETTGVRAELDVLQRALANTESARTRADRAVAGAIEDAALASARRQDAEQRETDAREARTRLEEEVTGLEWRRKVVSDELTSATEDLVASKAAANAGRDLAAQLSEHAAATRSETDEAEITLRQVQSQLASAELGLTQATSKADALRSHSVAEATSRIAVAETEATRAADEIREAALADIAASQTELEGMRAALTGELTAREVQARLLAEQVVTDASAAAARIRDRVQLQSTEILEEARTHAADIRAEATSLLESAQLQARKVETSQLEAAGVAAASILADANAMADAILLRSREQAVLAETNAAEHVSRITEAADRRARRRQRAAIRLAGYQVNKTTSAAAAALEAVTTQREESVAALEQFQITAMAQVTAEVAARLEDAELEAAALIARAQDERRAVAVERERVLTVAEDEAERIRQLGQATAEKSRMLANASRELAAESVRDLRTEAEANATAVLRDAETAAALLRQSAIVDAERARREARRHTEELLTRARVEQNRLLELARTTVGAALAEARERSELKLADHLAARDAELAHAQTEANAALARTQELAERIEAEAAEAIEAEGEMSENALDVLQDIELSDGPSNLIEAGGIVSPIVEPIVKEVSAIVTAMEETTAKPEELASIHVESGVLQDEVLDVEIPTNVAEFVEPNLIEADLAAEHMLESHISQDLISDSALEVINWDSFVVEESEVDEPDTEMPQSAAEPSSQPFSESATQSPVLEDSDHAAEPPRKRRFGRRRDR